MKRKYLISIVLISLFLTQTACGSTNSKLYVDQVGNEVNIGGDAVNIPSWKVDYINERAEITYNVKTKTIDGFTLLNCAWTGNNSIIIVDMDGNIVAAYEGFKGGPELINSTTVMMNNKSHVVFWNLETNAEEFIKIPGYGDLRQHHDIEYNPSTDTFMVLGGEINGTVEVAGEDFPIKHDTITEIDRDGNIIWHWRTYEHIPFNQTHFYLTNATGRGRADWTHGNTVFWDMEEENIVYFNARHLHTVYKIDKTTSEILWTVGEYKGDFTLYNKYGNEVSSLFYGAHSIERIGPNEYIIYDNDFWNTTDMSSQHPRYVEFVIDTDNWIATETWTWNVPNNETYIGDHWGDADRLPGNTRLGTFGAGGSTDMDYITEVNEAGEIIWEIAINGTDTYRADRFYSSPLVGFKNDSVVSIKKEKAVINFTTWNSFRERMSSDGKILVYDNDTLLLDYDFVFLPYWQDTELSLEIPTEEYKKGTYNLTIIIENADGISTCIIIPLSVERASAPAIIIGLSSILLVAVLAKKKRKYNQ